jgi:hypothetical protein
MKKNHVATFSMWVVMAILFSLIGQAQQNAPVSTNAVVPPLVKFSGTLTDLNGKPMSGVVGVTFALYKDEQGGAPLWLETQNAALDKTGHYTVMLGASNSSGLPAEIFVAGEARWLAVQAEGQPEQPRVLLLSVPYALKAGDAQTLGGLPASAFVLAAPPTGGATAMTATDTGASASLSAASVTPATSSGVTTSGGTVNALPLFTTATNIQNSLLTQTGTTAVNVGGRLNLPATGTSTAAAGTNSQPQTLIASSFDSTTSTAINQTFQWQAEPAANDTANPSGTLNLLFGAGATKPAETGLKVASNGTITFAPGQVFPGAVTGVTAGTDLTATGTGNVTLNLNTAATDKRYAQLNASNTFTGTQAISGTFGVIGNSLFIGKTTAANGEFTTNLGVGVGSPKAALEVAGNGADALVGDPGCGSGYTAVGFTNGGPLSGCTNYALLGGPSGGTFLNASGTASIHFRSNNNELAVIDNSGNVDVKGINGGGNLTVDGNAEQARGKGGFVKALAYINPLLSGSSIIVRCYNSQTGSSTPPCGFHFTYVNLGDYILDFGFQISDRFAQVTPVMLGHGSDEYFVSANVCEGTCSAITSSQIEVLTFYPSGISVPNPPTPTNTPFFITVF